MRILHNYVDVNGVRLHYAHKGSGRAIIFLHGFPACWYVWQAQLDHFGSSMWAIAPDGRGVNLSSKPARLEAYHIDRLAADIVGLADHLGIETFTLVGHDWGGAVAWKLGQRYAPRISKLVIINAPPYELFLWALATMPEQQKASAYIERLKARTAEVILGANDCAHLWEASFAPHQQAGIYSDEDQAYYTRAWQIDGALTGFLNWYRANVPDVDQIDANAYLPTPDSQIKVPTLLLWGEHEQAFTKPLLNLIPKYASEVTIRLVAGANHWIFLEQPTLFSQLVNEFVN